MDLSKKTINEQNLFWREEKRKFKKEEGIIKTFLGFMEKSEYEMLLSLGAISKDGIKDDGYIVTDKNKETLYCGGDELLARGIKNEKREYKIDRIPHLYPHYLLYCKRLQDALDFNRVDSF
jgi:hypothetical protein